MKKPDWDKLSRDHDRMLGDPSQAVDEHEESSRCEALAEWEEKKADEERDERYSKTENIAKHSTAEFKDETKQ